MTTDARAARGPFNRLNLVLWAVQVFLALLYLAAGGAKVLLPIDALAAAGMSSIIHIPEVFVRIIGILEVLGAIGLILPAAMRILPGLTTLAALGFVLLQIGAIVTHALLGETATTLPLNLVLLSAALFIAWGRSRRVRISPR